MSASTKKLTVLAMLTALSAVLITLVHFPLFPAAAFLEYDPADVAILIGTFAFGPMAGLAVTVIASAIQAFLLGGAGMYGFLMHVIASGTLVLVAGNIYRLFHTRMGGLIALVAGTVAMGLVMMVANHFITPFYMGAPHRSSGRHAGDGHPPLQSAEGGHQLGHHLPGVQDRVLHPDPRGGLGADLLSQGGQ